MVAVLTVQAHAACPDSKRTLSPRPARVSQAVLNMLVEEDILPALLPLLHTEDPRVLRQVIRNLHSCAVNPVARYAPAANATLPWQRLTSPALAPTSPAARSLSSTPAPCSASST